MTTNSIRQHATPSTSNTILRLAAPYSARKVNKAISLLDLSAENWLMILNTFDFPVSYLRDSGFMSPAQQNEMFPWLIANSGIGPDPVGLAHRIACMHEIDLFALCEVIERFWTRDADDTDTAEFFISQGIRFERSAHERLDNLARHAELIASLSS